MADWVCYTLCYPSGEPFYVGAGTRRRLRSYMRNRLARVVVEEIRSFGGEVVQNYEEFETSEAAFARELELIRLHGRRSDGGKLTNMRIGDRGGVQGRVMSAEQRRQISESATGRTHSEETKAKMSASRLGNQNRRGYVYTTEEKRLRSEQTRAGIARRRAEREKTNV